MPHEVKVRGFTELSEGLELEFVHSVPHELTCSSCQDLVGILWLSSSCEHRFCTRCLEALLGQASKSFCPVDQAEISRGQLVEDTSVQTKASQFQAWCPNRDQGCTITPRICDLRNHLRQCNQVMMSFAPPGGDGNGSSSANNEANSSTSSSGNMEPDVTPRCWMADFGCDFQGSASEVEAHENDWQQHRRMIVTRLSEYRRNLEDIQNERDVLRNQVNEVNATLKGLNLGFEHHCTHSAGTQNELRNRIQQMEHRLAQYESQGGAVQPTTFQLQPPQKPSAPTNFESIGFSNQMSMAPTEAPMASMASMAPPSLPANNSRVKGRIHHRRFRGDRFSSCSLYTTRTQQDQVMTCPDGQFRWLLKEYSRAKRHQRHGTHRYSSSPIFCTGNPGYWLQLRIHLNGIGQSRKGRFMAVQLVLLRGPNDSELPWPFRHRVTVTLLNQNGPQHVSYTINDPSFPRSQGEHTVPYVWQEFVAFSDLEANPGLAWNDSLLFELTVTPPSPLPPGLYPPL
ncbi:TNF receptor-associated factor 3-like isoform X1 [Dermacentor variabilis]|uniref:TNF receptor-associated factor 3-like isoform X1 n=2 Tax=Dermacentor variabilis TaxID=34621 RepID=UPI003F5C2E63